MPDGVTEDGYEYVLGGDSATVVGYTGNETALAPPEEIEGLPVRAIGEGAFSGNSYAEQLILPEGLEEIGAEADQWTDMGALIASPGCYGETLYLFMARGLRFGETHPDEDEFLDVTYLPFDRAVAQCMDGTLTDAKTVAAILKAKILLGR